MSPAVPCAQEADIAVFKRGDRVNGLPAYRLASGDAQWLVDSGVARWVNRKRKSIIMLIDKSAVIAIRGASCTMKPWVTEKFVEGSAYYAEIVKSWESSILPIAA